MQKVGLQGAIRLLLAFAVVVAGDETHASDLWRVERANAAACARRVEVFERTMRASPVERGVVIVKDPFGGGLGNELNSLTHAALHALALNRSLCAHGAVAHGAKGSRVFALMASPALDAARDPGRSDACARMSRNSVVFSGQANWKPAADVAVRHKGASWTPMSLGNRLTKAVAAFFGKDYETTLACVHHALYRPGPLVRAAAAPYLRKLRAGPSLGLHLRTHDMAMARHQELKGRRRLGLKRSHRRGCLRPPQFAEAVGKRACGARNSLVVFVGADHAVRWRRRRGDRPLALALGVGRGVLRVVARPSKPSTRRVPDEAFAQVSTAVVMTEGVPTHTGRGHRDQASAHAGSMKALLDFFLLTETDVLASNCAYVCSGGRCGNTYMFNVHTHRAPAFARRERFLRGGYACPPPDQSENDTNLPSPS